MPASNRLALTDDERTAIILAVQSAFTKLRNLCQKIQPIFQSYGFTAPSAGVIARDLSEKIEASIIQHCDSFSKGQGHCDLARAGQEWEVKICKDSGLTINQSKQIRGENYIVVNYRASSQVTRIWVLWEAQDSFFSARKPNANARGLNLTAARENIEVLFTWTAARSSAATRARQRQLPATTLTMVKAALATRKRRKSGL